MYRPTDLSAGLLNVLGWRQYFDTSEFSIADSLTVSEFGQYFQDIHALLTLDNVKAIAPDFKRITLAAWDETAQYRVGDRVSFLTKDYRVKIDNLNKQPDINPNDWELFDSFSEWLEQKTKASILKAVQNFWSQNITENTAKNILESKTLFDGAGRLTDTIAADENLVGFELVCARAKGVTVRIDKIGLQFKGTGTFNLYLMHSSQKEPIKTIPITITNDNGMQWFTQDELYLPYLSDSVDAGGSWYLVYDKANIPVELLAVNKSKDWSKEPCSGCNQSEATAFASWSRYLEVHPFKVPGGEFITGEMWDVVDNLYTYSTNYGINLQITIECDITDVLIEQRKSLQNVIGLQLAADMIREFAYNPNYKIGRQQQNFSRLELLYELDGDSRGMKRSGILWELTKAMKAISLDMKGVSRICFPCSNGGIKYRTA
ncbi:MAG: hypothetical protein HQ522_07860 [Bacteroidetes bacterium]|nr:hypothetical protein [Bacteroidota bacterium]